MATTTYTRAEITALVERLANRSHSAVFSERPELQRDIRALCYVAYELLIRSNIEYIQLECKKTDKPEDTGRPHIISNYWE